MVDVPKQPGSTATSQPNQPLQGAVTGEMRSPEPVSVWEWIVVLILTGIPVLNLLVLLYLIFSKNVKQSLRNYGIAGLIFLILAAVIMGIAFAFIFATLVEGGEFAVESTQVLTN